MRMHVSELDMAAGWRRGSAERCSAASHCSISGTRERDSGRCPAAAPTGVSHGTADGARRGGAQGPSCEWSGRRAKRQQDGPYVRLPAHTQAISVAPQHGLKYCIRICIVMRQERCARETGTAPEEPAGTPGANAKPAAGEVTYRDIFLRWVWLGYAVTVDPLVGGWRRLCFESKN